MHVYVMLCPMCHMYKIEVCLSCESMACISVMCTCQGFTGDQDKEKDKDSQDH